jgi:hypothetical protein
MTGPSASCRPNRLAADREVTDTGHDRTRTRRDQTRCCPGTSGALPRSKHSARVQRDEAAVVIVPGVRHLAVYGSPDAPRQHVA